MIDKKFSNLPYDIINVHPRLTPRYLMSPFNTEYLDINNRIALKAKKLNNNIAFVDKYFNDGKSNSYITKSGKDAIAVILRHLRLIKGDEVCIINTSGSPYISSCVTDEINRLCSFSRQVTRATKCIFVIHEFGYPAEIPNNIIKLKLPIIEDCAYALSSQNKKKNVGKIGDYTIYSFSKMFPVQYGGLIRSKQSLSVSSDISEYSLNYLLALLVFYFKKNNDFQRKRLINYSKYVDLFAQFGIYPLFKLKTNNIPAAFVFQLSCNPISDNLKTELNAMGVESTVYYGGDGFYIPCHQNLTDTDIEYIFKNVIKLLNKN